MALHPHQGVASTRITKSRSVLETCAAVTGILKTGFLKTEVTFVSDLLFGILKNGGSTGFGFTLPANTAQVTFSGANISVNKGDFLSIRPVGWSTFAKIGPRTFCQYEIDDGIPDTYSAESTTELTIGTGEKVFTVPEGLAYVEGIRVRAISQADPSNWMEGEVTDYTDDELTADIDLISGSGTLDDWTLRLAGERGATGETGPQGPAGGAASRTTELYEAGTLADLATEDGVIEIGKGIMFLRIEASHACRVRIYSTAAYRTADAAREIGTDPVGEHGVVLDANIEAANLVLDLNPIPIGFNMDTVPEATLYLAIQNRSGGSADIDVTFHYVQLVA